MNRFELEETLHQFRTAWQGFTHALPLGETRELDDALTIISGNSSWAMLNVAFLREPPTPLQEAGADAWKRRLEPARAYFRRNRCQWLLTTFAPWIGPEDEAALAAEGLKLAMSVTGMVAERLTPPRRPPPGELELRRVRDEATRNAVADINAHAYHVPVAWGREAMAVESFWRSEKIFGYVGYADGIPVATATVLPIDGILYLAQVATLPEYRQRGYAEAVMRKALEEAGRALGMERTVLHASPMGRPLYRGMGYHDVADFHFWSED